MILRRLADAGKGLMATALHRSGLAWRSIDRRLEGRVLVLMYHRVLPEHGRDSFSSPGIVVTPETFDRQVQCIRSNFSPLTADEFGGILDGSRRPPKRACLVTFDDGWFDNLAYALPILDRHGVPALLFAASGFVGTTRCFWQERLGRLLHAAWQAGPAGTEVCRSAGAETTPGSAEQHARRSILDAVARCKRLQSAQVETLLSGIEAQLTELGQHVPSTCGDDRFLSWAELKELAEHPLITVGSHAESHVPLPRLTTEAVASELAHSRERLQDAIGRQVEWFAYPNGDHDSRSADLVRAAGYRGAFTTVDGPADPRHDAFRIQRVNVHEGATRTLSRFLCRTAGLF